MGDELTRDIIGGVLMIGGVIAGALSAPVVLTMALLNIGAGLILAGEPFDLGQHQGFQISAPNTLAPVPVVYGRTKLAPTIADWRKDPNDDDIFWIVAAVCDAGMRTGGFGGIVDFREIYFDDRLAVNAAGTVQSPFAGYLTVYEHNGNDGQTVDSNLTAAFPTEWPSTSKGHAIAYLVFKLTFHPDVYHGVPNITVVVDGAQLWDTRGSPAWSISSNNAMAIRDYLLSDRYGLGAAAAEIDETSFAAAADYCDVDISIPDGGGGSTTQDRFQCNGIVDTSRQVNDNLNALLSSCRGQLIYENGQFRLYIPTTETAEVFELNESNIIGDWEFSKAGIDEVVNIVEATFIDEDNNDQPNIARFPQIGESNPFLTTDNSFEARRRLNLPFTKNIYMAEQIADTTLKETRNDVTVAVTVKNEGLKVHIGDVVKINHETPGWTDKLFRLMFVGHLQDGNRRFILREYAASAYTLGSQSDAATYPDSDLPDIFTVAAPTGLAWASTVTESLETNSGKIPRAKVTWTHSTHGFLDYEDLFFRENGASDWLFVKRVQASETEIAYIVELDAGVAYDVGVRAMSIYGKRSSMAELLNQTAYDPDAFDPSVNAPDPPDSVVLTATSLALTLDDQA